MWYVLIKEEVTEINSKILGYEISNYIKLKEYNGYQNFLETDICYTKIFEGTKQECEKFLERKNGRKMNDVQLENIDNILTDKFLFWKYVCGSSCNFCKIKDKIMKMPKAEQDKNNTISGFDETPPSNKGKGKISTDKLALLKLKMNNLKNGIIEKEVVSCDDCSMHKKDRMDEEKVSLIMDKSINVLKRSFDIWKKQGYNINGFMELKGSRNGLEFRRTYNEVTEIIRYCPHEEQIWGIIRKEGIEDSPKIFSTLELLTFNELLKFFNEDAFNFFKTL